MAASIRYAYCRSRPEQFRDLEEAFDEAGVATVVLTGLSGKLVSKRTDWQFVKETCWWVKAALKGWATDVPSELNPSRHNWLQSNAVRLACMQRHGCLTEEDAAGAKFILEVRFEWLLANTGSPRQAEPNEFRDCINWGIDRCESKTDEEVKQELSEHKHDKTIEEPEIVLADLDWDGISNAVWVWESHWAVGELSLIGGFPGTGKSLINHYAVGALTRGELPGAYLNCADDVRVLLVSTEEHEQHVLAPHLLSAGAVRTKVKTIKWANKPGTAILKIKDNWQQLEAILRQYRPTVLILDPIASKISKNGDANKDQDVRDAIEPLLDLAREIRMAVVGVMHFNKAGNEHLLYAFSGSTAWGALCRAASVVVPDESSGLFTLGQVKNSLGRKLTGVFPYSIEEDKVENPKTGEVVTSARVQWLDATEAKEQDIEKVAANYKRRNDKKNEKQEEIVQSRRDISTVLVDYLRAEENGELLWADARQLLIFEKLIDPEPNSDPKSKEFKQWENNVLRKVRRATDSEKRIVWSKTSEMPARSKLKFRQELTDSI